MKHFNLLLIGIVVLALVSSTVQSEIASNGRSDRDSGHGRNDRDSGHGRSDRDSGHGRNDRDSGHGRSDRDSGHGRNNRNLGEVSGRRDQDSHHHHTDPVVPVIPPVVYPCFTTQECGNFKMTAWINRDAPSGTGDFETVADAVSLGGCAAPLWVECQTTTGINWWLTNETIEFGPAGCVCKNAAQADLVCNYNYQIRELCPN
jgi:hypothetical protein